MSARDILELKRIQKVVVLYHFFIASDIKNLAYAVFLGFYLDVVPVFRHASVTLPESQQFCSGSFVEESHFDFTAQLSRVFFSLFTNTNPAQPGMSIQAFLHSSAVLKIFGILP